MKPCQDHTSWNPVHGYARFGTNRNGFYYVLDRVTGRFLRARSFVKQNWASQIDAQGRPVLSPAFSPSLRGTAIYPGAEGGTNWQSPTYSPRTGTFYVTTREAFT